MGISISVEAKDNRARQDDETGWSLGLALPPPLTVSQWADAKRVLSREYAAEPGRWNTDRAPYQREMMDAANDPGVEVIVLKLASQLGKSEVLNNICGYHIDQDPGPILLVLPTLELAEAYSKNRIAGMIRDTPALLELVGPQRSRDSGETIRLKEFPGGYLAFAGANSAASLSSRPIRIVLCDEIDKYKEAIGNDGDPIDQAFQRTRTFWNAKKVLASTATIKGLSAISAWYDRSDQRRFLAPCHECGSFQFMEWEQITWPEGEPEKAEYSCKDCGASWDQRHVRLAVRHGHWEAEVEFNGIAGFHLNALYSPWVTMAQLAREWEAAKGKPAKEQTFVNLQLGLEFELAREAATTPKQLYDRREDYGTDRLPANVLLITAGVDVQGDRLEVQFVGWGPGDEVWVLDHVKIFGDPLSSATWSELDRLLEQDFSHPSGKMMSVEATAIDSGYLSQKVYDYCRAAQTVMKARYAIKGVAGSGRPVWTQSRMKIRGGGRLYLIGVDDAKTEIYMNLAKLEAGEGFIHFPAHLDLDYFEQLVSEKVKITYRGGNSRREWILPAGKRNEALDTMVAAKAARHSMSIDYDARRTWLAQTKTMPSLGEVAKLFS